MESERIFIIGDIHGCLGMLNRLMDKIDWRPDSDTLIFLGDYIDRGEDSKGVVELMLDLINTSSLVTCLMGNHEDIFLNLLAGEDATTFLANGGDTTLESYHIDGEIRIPPAHISFFKSLRPWIELEDYYIVHAGLRPGIEIEGQTREDLIWIRDPFIFSDYDFGKKVIFGHTPFTKPLVTDNKIGLDTGAVYGNRLTCLELPRMKFHFVEA